MNRYGAPTTYKRIRPDFGSGFILKRIYELTEEPGRERFAWPRKKDVYLGTPWYNRPGFASLLWSSLIKDGLIESSGGMQEYTYCSFYKNPRIGTRAAGRYAYGIGYTVRYHLTPKGRGVLFDMMDRYNKICEKKKEGKHNGIEFNTCRSLNTVGSVAEYDAKKDDIPAPPNPIERDILEKEALDCAKLAADYAGENQKLRAEKNDLNERLKKLVLRLEWLEHEVAEAKAVLTEIIK